MSSNLKLTSIAVLFTTSVLGASAAMASDAGPGDSQTQARQLLSGPHYSSVERLSMRTPRIAKASTANAHDDARGILQPKFVVQAGVSPFEGASGRIGDLEIDGHEQARRLLQR